MSSVLRRSPFILKIWRRHTFPSLPILVNNKQVTLTIHINLHVTPCCEFLHHVQQSLHSFLGLSKDRDVVDEIYVIKLVAVVGVLTAVFLVLANLQTMADTLILPSFLYYQASVHGWHTYIHLKYNLMAHRYFKSSKIRVKRALS